MARMFPTTEPTNRAERWVFEALRGGYRTSGWEVFHSIHVPDPDRPGVLREIDFVVTIPDPDYCVICLEVKGGSFGIDERTGMWYTAGGATLQSPREKVRKDMFALKNNFSYLNCFYDKNQQRLPSGDRGQLALECAVAFRDMDEPTPPLLSHLAESIWASDVRDQKKLVEKLRDIAEKTSCSFTRNQTQKRKAEEDLVNLRQELEPKPVPPPKNRIFSPDLDTLREELLVLTNDQLHNLQLVERNPKKCFVIDGAAGTGKTVLALELARQHYEEKGEKVALICSNPYLSSRFERWAKTLPDQKDGTVVTGTLADFSTFDSKKQEKFDYLIVDEAQNLCNEKSLSSMGQILKGGLTDGCWTMFGDFSNQQIASPDLTETGEEVLERLKNEYPRLIHDELETNCRNTCEIAAAVSMFVGIESPPRSGVHGPEIEIEYFDSPEGLDNRLDTLVTELKDNKIDSRQIILLSSSSDDSDVLSSREYGGWKLLNVIEAEPEESLDKEEVLSVSGDDLSSTTLRYSNIYDFQGLESEVVILVLPLAGSLLDGTTTLPKADHLFKLLYTGMSRAKAALIIVAHKSYEEHLELEPRFEPNYESHIESMEQLAKDRDSVS